MTEVWPRDSHTGRFVERLDVFVDGWMDGWLVDGCVGGCVIGRVSGQLGEGGAQVELFSSTITAKFSPIMLINVWKPGCHTCGVTQHTHVHVQKPNPFIILVRVEYMGIQPSGLVWFSSQVHNPN